MTVDDAVEAEVTLMQKLTLQSRSRTQPTNNVTRLWTLHTVLTCLSTQLGMLTGGVTRPTLAVLAVAKRRRSHRWVAWSATG